MCLAITAFYVTSETSAQVLNKIIALCTNGCRGLTLRTQNDTLDPSKLL